MLIPTHLEFCKVQCSLQFCFFFCVLLILLSGSIQYTSDVVLMSRPNQSAPQTPGLPRIYKEPSAVRLQLFGSSFQPGSGRQTQCQCLKLDLKSSLLKRLIIKVNTEMPRLLGSLTSDFLNFLWPTPRVQGQWDTVLLNLASKYIWFDLTHFRAEIQFMSHCKLAHMWVFRAKDITDHHFEKPDLLSAWSKYLKYMYLVLELSIEISQGRMYIYIHTRGVTCSSLFQIQILDT